VYNAGFMTGTHVLIADRQLQPEISIDEQALARPFHDKGISVYGALNIDQARRCLRNMRQQIGLVALDPGIAHDMAVYTHEGGMRVVQHLGKGSSGQRLYIPYVPISEDADTNLKFIDEVQGYDSRQVPFLPESPTEIQQSLSAGKLAIMSWVADALAQVRALG
jgi:hypothetical protein